MSCSAGFANSTYSSSPVCTTKSRKISPLPGAEALCKEAASTTSSGDCVDLSCATLGFTNAASSSQAPIATASNAHKDIFRIIRFIYRLFKKFYTLIPDSLSVLRFRSATIPHRFYCTFRDGHYLSSKVLPSHRSHARFGLP